MSTPKKMCAWNWNRENVECKLSSNYRNKKNTSSHSFSVAECQISSQLHYSICYDSICYDNIEKLPPESARANPWKNRNALAVPAITIKYYIHVCTIKGIQIRCSPPKIVVAWWDWASLSSTALDQSTACTISGFTHTSLCRTFSNLLRKVTRFINGDHRYDVIYLSLM